MSRTIEPDVWEEGFSVLCGDKISAGSSRMVFTCPLVPDCVVKVEPDPWAFQNMTEWIVWQRVKDTPAAKHFAACRTISPNGRILLMEKTLPAPPSAFPERMPVFFTDLKYNNFGFDSSGLLVCHDYGVNHIVEHGTTTKRTKQAFWVD